MECQLICYKNYNISEITEIPIWWTSQEQAAI
jgi:hypothetical protein